MITCIREIRLARKLTLQDVADRCVPPTTPQTIGRLETGTRTVSVGWLNRIAKALDVDAADLVSMPERGDLPVVAVLDGAGAHAPRRTMSIAPPAVAPGQISIQVVASLGEYRAGDEIWCNRLAPADFPSALNRDLLVPRPAGRFVFGRLLGTEAGKLHVLPLEAGARQIVVNDAPWAAVATRLIRKL